MEDAHVLQIMCSNVQQKTYKIVYLTWPGYGNSMWNYGSIFSCCNRAQRLLVKILPMQLQYTTLVYARC